MLPSGDSAQQLPPADPPSFTEPSSAVERGVPRVEAPATPPAKASGSEIQKPYRDAPITQYGKLPSSTQQQEGWKPRTCRSNARYGAVRSGQMHKPGFAVQQAHQAETLQLAQGFMHSGPMPQVMPPYAQQQVNPALEIALGLSS